MTAHGAGDEGGGQERFEYFMVRITRFARDPHRVSGLIERLGSGEKRSFDTGEQLARLVGSSFAPEKNMQSGQSGRNAANDCPDRPDANRS